MLLGRNFSLPEPDRPIGEYNPAENWPRALLSQASLFFHWIRPFKKDALEGLRAFQETAKTHQRELTCAVLSGRRAETHRMTHRRLEASVYRGVFSDLYLNPGHSSSAWKEQTARRLVEEGSNVVHIEDDLRAGLSVARVDDQYPDQFRVLVYILESLPNYPRLLQRAEINLPSNVLVVESFKKAAVDFAARLEKKAI
jgi:hypothetical protein